MAATSIGVEKHNTQKYLTKKISRTIPRKSSNSNISMNISPISISLISMSRRISRRVRRYINRKLIHEREKVMAVQIFRFLCRNLYVGIVQ